MATQLPDDLRRHKGMGSYIEPRFSLQKSLLSGVECVCSRSLSCVQLFAAPEPRLLWPWTFPGKNTGVGCPFLLQGIFPTQGSNPCLLHCRWILSKVYEIEFTRAQLKIKKNEKEEEKEKNNQRRGSNFNSCSLLKTVTMILTADDLHSN